MTLNVGCISTLPQRGLNTVLGLLILCACLRESSSQSCVGVLCPPYTPPDLGFVNPNSSIACGQRASLSCQLTWVDLDGAGSPAPLCLTNGKYTRGQICGKWLSLGDVCVGDGDEMPGEHHIPGRRGGYVTFNAVRLVHLNGTIDCHPGSGQTPGPFGCESSARNLSYVVTFQNRSLVAPPASAISTSAANLSQANMSQANAWYTQMRHTESFSIPYTASATSIIIDVNDASGQTYIQSGDILKVWHTRDYTNITTNIGVGRTCFNLAVFTTRAVCAPLRVQYSTTDPSGPVAYPQKSVISCPSGYFMDGLATLPTDPRCQVDTTWQPHRHCSPVSCGRHPAVENADVPTGEIVYPYRATISCHAGYQLTGVGSGQPQCLATGLFSTAQACTPKRINCGVYPAPRHGGVVPLSDIMFPERVTLSCSAGYALNTSHGDIRPQCTWNASFTDGAVCDAVRCSAYAPPPNGSVIPTTAVLFMEKVEIICDVGFQPKGLGDGAVTKPMCRADQTFETGVTCERVSCGTYPTLEHGSVVPATGPVKYGDSVRLSCNDGFILSGVGSEFPMCNTAGRFTAGKQCIGVPCGPYPAPLFSTVAPSGPVSYPDTVVITCDVGYQLFGSGSPFVSCLANATFTLGQKCVPVEGAVQIAEPASVVRPPIVELDESNDDIIDLFRGNSMLAVVVPINLVIVTTIVLTTVAAVVVSIVGVSTVAASITHSTMGFVLHSQMLALTTAIASTGITGDPSYASMWAHLRWLLLHFGATFPNPYETQASNNSENNDQTRNSAYIELRGGSALRRSDFRHNLNTSGGERRLLQDEPQRGGDCLMAHSVFEQLTTTLFVAILSFAIVSLCRLALYRFYVEKSRRAIDATTNPVDVRSNAIVPRKITPEEWIPATLPFAKPRWELFWLMASIFGMLDAGFAAALSRCQDVWPVIGACTLLLVSSVLVFLLWKIPRLTQQQRHAPYSAPEHSASAPRVCARMSRIGTMTRFRRLKLPKLHSGDHDIVETNTANVFESLAISRYACIWRVEPGQEIAFAGWADPLIGCYRRWGLRLLCHRILTMVALAVLVRVDDDETRLVAAILVLSLDFVVSLAAPYCDHVRNCSEPFLAISRFAIIVGYLMAHHDAVSWASANIGALGLLICSLLVATGNTVHCAWIAIIGIVRREDVSWVTAAALHGLPQADGLDEFRAALEKHDDDVESSHIDDSNSHDDSDGGSDHEISGGGAMTVSTHGSVRSASLSPTAASATASTTASTPQLSGILNRDVDPSLPSAYSSIDSHGHGASNGVAAMASAKGHRRRSRDGSKGHSRRSRDGLRRQRVVTADLPPPPPPPLHDTGATVHTGNILNSGGGGDVVGGGVGGVSVRVVPRTPGSSQKFVIRVKASGGGTRPRVAAIQSESLPRSDGAGQESGRDVGRSLDGQPISRNNDRHVSVHSVGDRSMQYMPASVTVQGTDTGMVTSLGRQPIGDRRFGDTVNTANVISTQSWMRTNSLHQANVPHLHPTGGDPPASTPTLLNGAPIVPSARTPELRSDLSVPTRRAHHDKSHNAHNGQPGAVRQQGVRLVSQQPPDPRLMRHRTSFEPNHQIQMQAPGLQRSVSPSHFPAQHVTGALRAHPLVGIAPPRPSTFNP